MFVNSGIILMQYSLKEGEIMEQIGLVLEGGGMRGVYTAGLLDFFMEEGLYFPYVIGVSAGACNATSYISRQKGRNKIVNIDYIKDPRYISYRNLLKEKSLFGMDFIFDEIPNRLTPFDYDRFYSSEQRFVITTTDCHTGKPVYFEKHSCSNILSVLRASSSLPFLAQPVEYEGFTLLDGGVSDPIPVKKSIEDGNLRNVIVLTRNKGYRKKPFKMKLLARKMYPDYECLVGSLFRRHEVYNETLDYIEKLESENKAFVFRPSSPIKVSRIEKDRKKLDSLYEMGYEDAKRSICKLKEWMDNE